MCRAGRLGGMKVASASNAEDKPAVGAAKAAAAAAKPPAKPAVSRGSRGKARKPIYVDSDRSLFLPAHLSLPAITSTNRRSARCMIWTGHREQLKADATVPVCWTAAVTRLDCPPAGHA